MWDTEQSKYHCHQSAERILKTGRMPTDRENGQVEGVFYVAGVQSQAAEANHQLCACFRPGDRLCVVIDGIRDLMYDINSPSESVDLIKRPDALVEYA